MLQQRVNLAVSGVPSRPGPACLVSLLSLMLREFSVPRNSHDLLCRVFGQCHVGAKIHTYTHICLHTTYMHSCKCNIRECMRACKHPRTHSCSQPCSQDTRSLQPLGSGPGERGRGRRPALRAEAFRRSVTDGIRAPSGLDCAPLWLFVGSHVIGWHVEA